MNDEVEEIITLIKKSRSIERDFFTLKFSIPCSIFDLHFPSDFAR